MKISARNALKGKVTSVVPGVVTAKVTIDIGGGKSVVSVVTLDSVKELDIKVGKEVTAIIKATDVLLGVE